MYQDALRPAWVEIDLSNLAYNIESIQRKVGPDTELIGVIKADAYGHGCLPAAQVLRDHGVRRFAVATVAEGLTLRKAGAKEQIIVLGLIPDMYADVVCEYALTPVFCTYENAKAFSEAGERAGKIVRALIALDTGMGRIGFEASEPEKAIPILKQAAALPSFEIAGVFSHFSTADEKSLDYTFGQVEKYRSFCQAVTGAGIPLPFRTLANSAAIMRIPEVYFDAVRPGIILYGLYPSHDVDRSLLDLKPVMSVKANIVYLKDVPADFSVSYGRKYISRGPAKIATIGMGYADGFPRPYSSAGKVIVNGVLCPIAGNICMDQFMVDVTEVPNVKTGDEVIIMGSDGTRSITADDIADATGTINYEITCAFGQRLPKVYVK